MNAFEEGRQLGRQVVLGFFGAVGQLFGPVGDDELERLRRAGETVVPGQLAFDLYQTHGLPVDTLEELAQEEGLVLDREGFERALERERRRGQESWKGDLKARFRPEYEDLVERGITTEFIGYDHLEGEGKVVALGDGKLLDNGERAEFQVKKGDRIIFASFGGTEVTVDGEEYLLMSEDDILAIVD